MYQLTLKLQIQTQALQKWQRKFVKMFEKYVALALLIVRSTYRGCYRERVARRAPGVGAAYSFE